MRVLSLAERVLPVVATSAGLVVWSNVVVPRLPPGPAPRAVANLFATAGLLAAGRRHGLSWAELGFGARSWRAGARWGGGALAAVTLTYGAALVVPGARKLLADPAVRAMSAREVAGRALLSIPLGTVACEELAFRGILQAVASRQLPRPAALGVTSAVFGVWHVDAVLADSAGGAARPPGGRSVALAVVLTGLGGLCLGWLRERTGSLLAPAGLHLGTNSVGLAAAVVASRSVDTLDSCGTSP